MVVVINVTPSISTTVTGPEPVAPEGTVALKVVLFWTVTLVAKKLPNETVETRLVPSPFRNPPPVIVTTVVPAGPLSGVNATLTAVSAAPGNKVPALGDPAVTKGLSTVSAAPGSKVPALGEPAVENGLRTVSAAPGNKVPALGMPGVVKGLSTTKLPVGSRIP